jgi:hypothetical protein
MSAKSAPVSHQKIGDIAEYSETWSYNHTARILAIPFVLAAMLAIVALVIL